MKKEKSPISYVIGQRNSSKKLKSLDQSGILLCRNKDCDIIKAYLEQIQLGGKKVFFFQSVAERTIDTALYTYVKTTFARQISLFVTHTIIKYSSWKPRSTSGRLFVRLSTSTIAQAFEDAVKFLGINTNSFCPLLQDASRYVVAAGTVLKS